MPPRARKAPTPARPVTPKAKPGEVRHFGPSEPVEALPAPVTFEVGFRRGRETETHTFTARPVTSYSDGVALLRGQRTNNSAILVATLDRAIRRMLVDDDGTPAKWEPADRTADTFIDPISGDEQPMSELEKVEAFDAGSSRRRWNSLLDDDDEDLTLDVEQVSDIYEYVISSSSDAQAKAS